MLLKWARVIRSMIGQLVKVALLRKISLSGGFPFALCHLLTLVIATLLINLTYTTLYRVSLAPNLFDVDAFLPSLNHCGAHCVLPFKPTLGQSFS